MEDSHLPPKQAVGKHHHHPVHVVPGTAGVPLALDPNGYVARLVLSMMHSS
jgi:hypothetical protein